MRTHVFDWCEKSPVEAIWSHEPGPEVHFVIVCLLIVLSRIQPDWPLLVAANRDEFLARPAVSMTVLEDGIVGGRDLLAGGTWLALNRHGVFAGLTNLPSTQVPRNPARRSRGELPLVLARHASARAAAAAFDARPLDYNPAWLMVGDAESLHYIDLTGGERATVTELPPGVHVLENKPLGEPSDKIDRVRAAVAALRGDVLVGLEAVLRSECVHHGPYGTRTGAIFAPQPEGGGAPAGFARRGGGIHPPVLRVRYTDGPPDANPFVDFTATAWRSR